MSISAEILLTDFFEIRKTPAGRARFVEMAAMAATRSPLLRLLTPTRRATPVAATVLQPADFAARATLESHVGSTNGNTGLAVFSQRVPPVDHYWPDLVATTKQIWIARPVPDKFGYEQRLVVDWTGITAGGLPATNWQLMPGDRLYIKGNTFTLVDTWISRITAPVERAAGFVLLGASSIRSLNASFRQSFSGGQSGF